MRVQIDQTRRHQPAGGAQHAFRPGGGDVGLDRLDEAEADADVASAAEVLARIDDLAALDNEIEFVVRTHRRVGGS